MRRCCEAGVLQRVSERWLRGRLRFAKSTESGFKEWARQKYPEVRNPKKDARKEQITFDTLWTYAHEGDHGAYQMILTMMQEYSDEENPQEKQQTPPENPPEDTWNEDFDWKPKSKEKKNEPVYTSYNPDEDLDQAQEEPVAYKASKPHALKTLIDRELKTVQERLKPENKELRTKYRTSWYPEHTSYDYEDIPESSTWNLEAGKNDKEWLREQEAFGRYLFLRNRLAQKEDLPEDDLRQNSYPHNEIQRKGWDALKAEAEKASEKAWEHIKDVVKKEKLFPHSRKTEIDLPTKWDLPKEVNSVVQDQIERLEGKSKLWESLEESLLSQCVELTRQDMHNLSDLTPEEDTFMDDFRKRALEEDFGSRSWEKLRGSQLITKAFLKTLSPEERKVWKSAMRGLRRHSENREFEGHEDEYTNSDQLMRVLNSWNVPGIGWGTGKPKRDNRKEPSPIETAAAKALAFTLVYANKSGMDTIPVERSVKRTRKAEGMPVVDLYTPGTLKQGETIRLSPAQAFLGLTAPVKEGFFPVPGGGISDEELAKESEMREKRRKKLREKELKRRRRDPLRRREDDELPKPKKSWKDRFKSLMGPSENPVGPKTARMAQSRAGMTERVADLWLSQR